MASRQSSVDLERRSSVRTSMRLSMRHDGAEEEEIDVEDYDVLAAGISDGFRPQPSDAEAAHDLRPAAPLDHLISRKTPPPRPSSISKPRADSFALQHDGAMGHVSSAAPSAGTTHHGAREVSSDSNNIVRPESPYRGPVGPSHPYHMYPQESQLARSASVATTTTVPVVPSAADQSYLGPSNPAHPYGMYPQNTIPEPEATSDELSAAPITIGFPGLQGASERREAQGEDTGDIIGSDGHTEQLPPYTRYPDAGFLPKAQSNAPPLVTPTVAGAGGLGLATRNPAYSEEDLNSPQSRESTRSYISDGESSDREINPGGAPVSEKHEPRPQRWQAVARRRLCGVIPVWALVLASIVLTLAVVVIAAVIAVVRPGRHTNYVDPPPQTVTSWAESVTVFTTTFDATIYPSAPTKLPVLPTGTYALPLSTPTVMQDTCVNDPSQLGTWSCNVPPVPLQIVVDPKQAADKNSEMIIEYQNHTVNTYTYGAQAPVMAFSWPLSLVIDSQDPWRGPAWFFECPYDKVVILPEMALNASNTDSDSKQVISRDVIKDYPEIGGVPQPGDKPWFCYWNGTLLETFIYINDSTKSSGSSSSTGSSGSSTSQTTSGAIMGRHYSSYTGTYSSSASSYTSSTPGNSYNTPAPSYPSSTSRPNPSPTYPEPNPTDPALGSEVSGSSPQSGPAAASSTPIPHFLDQYPKTVKVEERRIPKGPDSVPPYCLQHIIKPDGSARPYLEDGGENIIWLDETEPTSIVPIITNRDLEDLVEKVEELDERQSSCSCGCVWITH